MEKGKEELIQDYIDNLLGEEDRSSVEKKIETDPDWKKEYDQIREVDQMMNHQPILSARKDFTFNVISRLEKIDIRPQFKWKNLLLVFGIILSLFITAYFVQSSGIPSLEIPEQIQVLNRELPTGNFLSVINLEIITKGVLFGAFIMAMLLFDKAVIRPLMGVRVRG